ncbi:uncharacterized protein LOC116303833 [Actinia tenebrosa]|uniref:Uncharacterized protein LOC116303833 n=1 Tax=Actinia tenebrosa TaxID=6105 RepID=A0A6P8IQE9_ACTTE|nr:uncharacterized protein LOC116303833 [Actinia tenebrosa]
MNENMNEVEHQHKEKEKQEKTFKSSSTNHKTCSAHSNVTNYSAKSMSSCTSTSSGGASKQGHSGTLTVQSMSLCSTLTNDPNFEPKLVALGSVDEQALLPKNSTFNESGEQVMVQEFFSNHLSTIKDQDASSIKGEKIPSMDEEELQKKDTTSHSDEFQNNLIQNAEAQLKNSCVSHENTDNNGPKTSTPTDQAKLPAMLEVDVSPILEAPDGNNQKLRKHIDCQLETGVKRSAGKASQRNSLTRCSRDKSATTLDHKSKPQNHKAARTLQSQVQDLKENSKTSLPLQASICIEDDSDPEQIQDNITPEIMETNKSCPSSSKRKLDYSGAINRPDVNVCFLLDFKCTRKRPCKLWMRTESPCIIKSEQKEMCIPQDVLAII